MKPQHRIVELEVPPGEALAAYRRAFAELGWEILEADDAHLVAIEVPFRLNCLTSPSEVEIRARSAPANATVVALEGFARGSIGWSGSRRLAAHLATLQRRAERLIS